MTATPATQVPPLRIHKASGQGYVYLNGKRFYLGKRDKPETLQAYHRLIAEWASCGGQWAVDPECVTIKELIARFWVWAEQYYRKPDGTFTSELENYRQILRPLKALYADTNASRFGPKALRAVRQHRIGADRCPTNEPFE